VHEVVQCAVHVTHDPHVTHVQGQAHGEVQESHEAHQIEQHEQEVVLDALRSAWSCSGAVHVPYDPYVQGQAHVEVQEGHKAHTINQHEQEVVQVIFFAVYDWYVISILVVFFTNIMIFFSSVGFKTFNTSENIEHCSFHLFASQT
jgi:hypothetical protein